MIYPQYETIRSGHFKVVTVQGDQEPLNIQNRPKQGQFFGSSQCLCSEGDKDATHFIGDHRGRQCRALTCPDTCYSFLAEWLCNSAALKQICDPVCRRIEEPADYSHLN